MMNPAAKMLGRAILLAWVMAVVLGLFVTMLIRHYPGNAGNEQDAVLVLPEVRIPVFFIKRFTASWCVSCTEQRKTYDTFLVQLRARGVDVYERTIVVDKDGDAKQLVNEHDITELPTYIWVAVDARATPEGTGSVLGRGRTTDAANLAADINAVLSRLSPK
jgi:hypothetical protein